MSTFGFIEYNDASPEVRAVYDDIMATRKTDSISNFWKAIAHDPELLKRTWEDTKQIMAPGAAGCGGEGADLCCGERDQWLPLLRRCAYGLGAQQRHERRDVPRDDVRGRHGE